MIANTEEIKQSISMEELLRAWGKELNRQRRTTCPVHGGNDANFSAKDGYGTCFSQCAGKSWSVTDLVMEVKQLTFPEALEYIAQLANIDVKYTGQADRQEVIEAAKKERERKEVLYATNEAALAHYEEGRTLNFSESYDFDGRAWKGETVQAFRIVQAPNDNTLTKQKLIEQEPLQALGLIKYSEGKDVWYDFLRDRILFPIFTHRGQIAGFSGRKLSTAHADSPKYKNSQESLVYRKREMLYGLWQNRRNIQQEGALLFEGMADVVTAYDFGVTRAVAPGGTAVTKQQLMLLKRYTDQVTIMMDGDEAGLSAAKSAVEEAIAVGMRVEVCFFDEPSAKDQEQGINRYDPDNFLRIYGKDAFEAVLEEGSRDGLIWRVMQEWDDKDIHCQHAAVSLAARMVSLLDNDMVRDYYQRELCKKEYFGSVHKTHLGEAIKEEREQRLRDQNKPTLTAQQQTDIKKYGLYIKNSQYWVSGDEEIEGYPISNFSVHPVMLVVGSAKSERRVEIRNIYGAKFTANIDSDSFVEMAAFRKEVERRGNFMFLETFRPEHFVKLKRKLYDEMKVCYPITTLGRHAKMDFYAWANGIVADRFLPIDEHGIVMYNDVKFFLPAFATASEDILSDDQDNSYEDQKHFIYMNEVKSPSFESWSAKMKEVHGDKGMMAVGWYLAALYRDIIYDKMEFFPHLNCFGPPGTGKSFMGWSLSYMFGKARRPFNLHDGTNVGFFRRMAQVRNGIAWYDEYNNGIDFKRAQGLKNAYDGAGREKGVASTDNRTVVTQVNSALLITGQEMPTQDIALYTRCITMSFPETQRTEEQKARANELVAIQQSGCLSQITSDMQQYRRYVADNFDRIYDDVRHELSKMLQGREVLDRLINNYSIPMAVTLMLKDKIGLGFKWSDLTDFGYRNLIWQSDSISQEDDLAQWWDAVHYHVERGDLTHNMDLVVQEINTITVRDPGGKATDTVTLNFASDIKILFLTFTKSYPLYREQLRRMGNNGGLNKEAVRYYLKSSSAFIGEVRAKKMNGQAKKCYAFDMEKLAFDLPISSHVGDMPEDEQLF